MVKSSEKKKQQKVQSKQLNTPSKKPWFFSRWPVWVKISLIIVAIYIIFVVIGTIITSVSSAFKSWLDTLGKDCGKLATTALWGFLFYAVAVWAVPALGSGASKMWKKYQLYNQNKSVKDAAEELGCTEEDWKNGAEEFKKENGREPTSSELQLKMYKEMKQKGNESFDKKIEEAQKRGDQTAVEELAQQQEEFNKAGEEDVENAESEAEGGGGEAV